VTVPAMSLARVHWVSTASAIFNGAQELGYRLHPRHASMSLSRSRGDQW
jgi:hypothetical protein